MEIYERISFFFVASQISAFGVTFQSMIVCPILQLVCHCVHASVGYMSFAHRGCHSQGARGALTCLVPACMTHQAAAQCACPLRRRSPGLC